MSTHPVPSAEGCSHTHSCSGKPAVLTQHEGTTVHTPATHSGHCRSESTSYRASTRIFPGAAFTAPADQRLPFQWDPVSTASPAVDWRRPLWWDAASAAPPPRTRDCPSDGTRCPRPPIPLTRDGPSGWMQCPQPPIPWTGDGPSGGWQCPRTPPTRDGPSGGMQLLGGSAHHRAAGSHFEGWRRSAPLLGCGCYGITEVSMSPSSLNICACQLKREKLSRAPGPGCPETRLVTTAAPPVLRPWCPLVWR